MHLEFHCLLHLSILKREEGKRAELQNNFGILYRESIMTLEENGSLSTVRCSCLLTGNTGMSLLLCGAGNENTSGELSCSGSSRGELVLAFGPGLIYPRTVSDMSAGAGNKCVKANAQARKTRSWDHAGGGGVVAWHSWREQQHPSIFWKSTLTYSGGVSKGVWERPAESYTELGWRQEHHDLQGLCVGDLFFPTAWP